MHGDIMTNDGPCLKLDPNYKICCCKRPIDHDGRHECDECRYWWDEKYGTEGLRKDNED